MRWGGVILLLFVIYHLLHLTTGTVHPSFIEGDVYHNFVAGFQSVPASLFYIVAMIFLVIDVDIVFFYPFATIFAPYVQQARDQSFIMLMEMFVFVSPPPLLKSPTP